jgi:hypothetical protein
MGGVKFETEILNAIEQMMKELVITLKANEIDVIDFKIFNFSIKFEWSENKVNRFCVDARGEGFRWKMRKS